MLHHLELHAPYFVGDSVLRELSLAIVRASQEPPLTGSAVFACDASRDTSLQLRARPTFCGTTSRWHTLVPSFHQAHQHDAVVVADSLCERIDQRFR